MKSAGAGQDVDVVLTTRELVRMVRAEHIDPKFLMEQPFDSPLGESTGAGVIFGVTGGVMEAALRTAYAVVEGHNSATRKSILRDLSSYLSNAVLENPIASQPQTCIKCGGGTGFGW